MKKMEECCPEGCITDPKNMRMEEMRGGIGTNGL